MSDRMFPEAVVHGHGGASRVLRICCAKCGAHADFHHIKGGKKRPSIVAVNHFRRNGWEVGTITRKDFCATCAAAKREKTMPDVVALKASPPKQMTREERRIINDKLDEVYGKDAYKHPWTDAKVAADLGIPRAWVEDVRSQFFGEAGSNPAIDDYLDRTKKFEADMKSFEARVAEVKRVHADIDTWRTNLSKQADELYRIGSRLEREIGR